MLVCVNIPQIPLVCGWVEFFTFMGSFKALGECFFKHICHVYVFHSFFEILFEFVL